MITSAAEVTTLQRQMASAPVIMLSDFASCLMETADNCMHNGVLQLDLYQDRRSGPIVRIPTIHSTQAMSKTDALRLPKCALLRSLITGVDSSSDMTDLFRFSWYSLLELLRDLPAIGLLQFTGALVRLLFFTG